MIETLESRWLLSGAAYTFSPVAFFDTSDLGSSPQSNLVADPAGNVFGTNSNGGAFGAGTVFEIPAGGTITTLASFNHADGADPDSLIMDSAGNLYGTTFSGGAGNAGTVFEIAKGTNAISTLGSFGAGNGVNPAGVTVDADGNLFGTTLHGGDVNDGTVFEIAAGSNTVTTLASFNGVTGAVPTGGVTLDSAGNLWGTTQNGGPSDDGTLFEIAKGSNSIDTLVAFNGSNGMYPQGTLTSDSSGNLYGTTEAGGAAGYGTVFEIAQGSGTFTTLASADGHSAVFPHGGVIADSSGNLYGSSSGGGVYGDGTVFEIAKGSGAITMLAPLTNGLQPVGGVLLDAAGDLYGTASSGGDNGGGTVFKLTRGATSLTTLASFSNTSDGSAQGALILDSAGNLYGATDNGGAYGDGTIFELPAGSNRLAARGIFHFTAGSGDVPNGNLAVDSAGNLYGGTRFGGASGEGTLFEIPAGTNTVATLLSFSGPGEPTGVTMDAAGNLYGAPTSGNGAVFEFDKQSHTFPLWAYFNGTNGSDPSGVVIDSAGNIYGTTGSGGANGYGTVFEIAAGTSTITTLASFDGTNGENPYNGVTLDPAGNLYGTTSSGGANGYGTIFEIVKGSNVITMLASLSNSNGGN
ncbi:MAG TPA: choice-of-anchor tandem repeat GloVer-containing protein, partial [Tepidisphaeraceae bacterium]|nr:choice-of-anchor tandem repeat GloVer-containing protein [Tepidisphaeraceae bacterium]